MPMLMSAPEWRALDYLRDTSCASLGAVAAAMSVAPDEGSLILDHLVYRGLIDRQGDDLRLTESGEELLHE